MEGLKADLQQQLESHSSLPGQQKLSDQEADVIDLVGMLFDFILDDDNLPDNCKTALSHLHTPYLKVALQDKATLTRDEMAKIIGQVKGPKINGYTYKRRTNQRRRYGHRQRYTVVKITSIAKG